MSCRRYLPSFLWILLLVSAGAPALRAQEGTTPAPVPGAVAAEATPVSTGTPVLEQARLALQEATQQRKDLSSLQLPEREPTEANAEALAAAAELLQSRKDFAEERLGMSQTMLKRLEALPSPEDAVAFLEARRRIQEVLDRRSREAALAHAQADLLAKQGGQTGMVTLAKERAAFLDGQATLLTRADEELGRQWLEAYPDAETRKTAEAAAFKALSEARKQEQEEVQRKTQEQAAAREQQKREAEELAEKARRELEQARNEDEQQLAELRLRFAQLKAANEDFKVNALKAQAEAKSAEEEESTLRAELAERMPLLTARQAPRAEVQAFRKRLDKKTEGLRQQIDLLAKELELAREKIPGFRQGYRNLVELYDQLEEGMAENKGSSLYRQRVYFARLAQREASEKLDQYRTFVEWRERTQVTWLRLAEALEKATAKLEPLAERRILGQTQEQAKRFGFFLLLTLLASLLVDFLARTLFKSFSAKTAWTWDDIALEELSTPIRILVFLGGLQVSLEILTLHENAQRLLTQWGGALRAAWIGFLAWRLLNIVSRVLEPSIAASEAKLDDQLYRFLQRGLRSVIVGATLVFILEAFGWKVTSLLAGLGIGGLAFALAAKDTLANLFGSIVLFMDRPFKVGNWVIISGVEGVVEDIGIRSTRIRTFRDTLVTIPNANVANSTAENVHSFRKRRLYFTIELRFDTPVDTIEKAVDEIRELLQAHPMILDGFFVYVSGIKASGVEIMIYSFVATRDWQEWLVHCQDVYLSVLRTLERLGAGLAFPTQTIELEHVKGLPPGLSPFSDRAPMPGPGEGPREES